MTVTFEETGWPEAVLDAARKFLAMTERHVATVLSTKGAKTAAPPALPKEPELLPPPGMDEDEESGDIVSGFRDDVHQL